MTQGPRADASVDPCASGGGRRPASPAGAPGVGDRCTSRMESARGEPWGPPRFSSTLLQLDAGPRLLELGLRETLLDGAGGAVDEILRLLETEAGRGADDLDHLDLLVARGGEHDVEGVLLLRRRSAVPTRGRRTRRSDRDRSGRRDAPLLLDRLLQLDELEHRHLAERVQHLCGICSHPYSSSVSAVSASVSVESADSVSAGSAGSSVSASR